MQRQPSDEVGRLFLVVGVSQLQNALADEVVRGLAEGPCQRWTDVSTPSIQSEDRDHVRPVLDHRLKAPLRFLQRLSALNLRSVVPVNGVNAGLVART